MKALVHKAREGQKGKEAQLMQGRYHPGSSKSCGEELSREKAKHAMANRHHGVLHCAIEEHPILHSDHGYHCRWPD